MVVVALIEDIVPPKMLNNRELVVMEGSKVKLTTEYLSFTDVDSEPGSLRYFLVTAPQLGHLELTENTGKILTHIFVRKDSLSI